MQKSISIKKLFNWAIQFSKKKKLSKELLAFIDYVNKHKND